MFRDRNREKEMSEKEFKFVRSDGRDLMFVDVGDKEKFDERKKGVVYRKDNKTQVSPTAFRRGPENEVDRI